MPSRKLLSQMLGTLRQAPFPYAFVTTDLTVEYHNAAAAEWLGKDGRDFMGTKVHDLMSADELETILPQLEKAFAGEVVEYQRTLPSQGRARTSIAHYVPEMNADEAVVGVHVFLWDVTEYAETERTSRVLRDRFEGAFTYSATGMAIVAPDGRFMDVNAAFCEMLGYSQEELLTGDFQGLTYHEDLEPDIALLNKLLSGGADSYTLEKRYVSKSGNIIWGILTVSVVRNEDGSVAHFVSQVQDITSRKLAEERLYREHELADVTLRSIGDGVITCDPDGRINYLNPVAETLTGWSMEDAHGLLASEVFRVFDKHGDAVPCPLSEALKLGKVVNLTANSELRTRKGDILPVDDSAAPIHDRSGAIIGGVLVFHDVSEQRAMAVTLEYMANHDTLTGLPNRSFFNNRLLSAVRAARRDGNRCAVIFCDVDHFKTINDTHGHAVGDEVLKAVSGRLKQMVRTGDTVCRWAGDEFVILLSDIQSRLEVERIAERIVAIAEEPVRLRKTNHLVDVSLSLGISICPDDATDREALLWAADTALYEVKRNGRSAFLFHHIDFNKQQTERQTKERLLREALEHGSFEVHYQPRVSFKTGQIVGAEALVRMRQGDKLIMPGDFIGVAEEAGLISELGRVVFRKVCRQIAEWNTGPLQHLCVSINVSPLSFGQSQFIDDMLNDLATFNVPTEQFELEITEGVFVGSDSKVQAQLDKLHKLGFRLALDDFGTGFSNLSYLRRLPIDTLKIDRSFVSQPRLDRPIVEAIISLARNLEMKVVVEGVETKEQEDALRKLGCHEAQGYLYSKALPADRLEQLYRTIKMSA